jgi:hypothetical protein
MGDLDLGIWGTWSKLQERFEGWANKGQDTGHGTRDRTLENRVGYNRFVLDVVCRSWRPKLKQFRHFSKMTRSRCHGTRYRVPSPQTKFAPAWITLSNLEFQTRLSFLSMSLDCRSEYVIAKRIALRKCGKWGSGIRETIFLTIFLTWFRWGSCRMFYSAR